MGNRSSTRAAQARKKEAPSPLQLLVAVCRAGDVTQVLELLERQAGADLVNALDASGFTPLMVICASGHCDLVGLLVRRGALVDAKGANGWTALHLASRNGHQSVVTELLLRGANVDAANVNGSTPLYIASQEGHLSVVTELLLRGANVDAAEMNGVTPLYVASQEGHLSVVTELLLRGANVACETKNLPLQQSVIPATQAAAASFSSGGKQLETVDARGCTPLLAAARSGHFEVVQYLLKAGSCAHARSTEGDTILVAAGRWRNTNIILELEKLGVLLPKGDSDAQETLLIATLQSLKDCSPQLNEFQQMWLRLVDRLLSINDRFTESPEAPRDDIIQFVMIVFNMIRLEAACKSKNAFARLVASPTIATRFRDLHTELTYLEQATSLNSFDELRERWECHCEQDETELLRLFGANIGDSNGSLDRNSASDDERLESACLLQHKVRRQGESCSPDMKALLDISLRKFYDPHVEQPLVSEWFIPPHELDVSDAEASSTEKTIFQSKWASSFVTISLHRLPRDTFMEAVEKCFRQSHPNVVKVFGASHIQAPFPVVFENTASTSLREFLASEENKHLLWQMLFEVSLGLKYLAERGIILGSLRCDDIWVGLDGLAKINAMNCVASQDEPAVKRCARWQAPEVLRGELPSAASTIYSLGMCIVESVTGEVPWVGDTDEMARLKVLYNYQPQVPEGMTFAQRGLLESMWRIDPSKRPTISNIVLQLKQFANEQNSRPKSQGVSEGKTQSLNLEQFISPELGSNIKCFLDRLAAKCRYCSESPDQVQHIFERLLDVYSLLQSQHRLHRDVAAKMYCEVLVRLDHFLKIVVHEKSVLLQVKSQRVALRSNEFHRRLDELLELLAPQVRHSIHVWKLSGATSSQDNDDDASDSERKRDESLGEGQVPPSSAPSPPANPNDTAVQIVRFDSDRVNDRFKELDFTFIDAAAANEDAPQLPWFIQTYNLQYSARDQIGVGAFGEVYRAMWLSTPVVIKFMGYEADEDAYSRDMFFHELRVWFPLNHPHVIKLYGACHVGKRFFVCEFVGNGTLDQYLKRDGNEDKSWQLLYQVALGLQHLHENNILHNDLKCDNVLIGTDGDAKLMDFGLSSILNSAEVMVSPKNQGAVHWKSPEYLRGDRPTLASDIYSFGMLILEALTGEMPWGNSTRATAVRYQLLRMGGFPLRPACLSNDAHWKLIKMVCAVSPAQRVQISFVVDKLHALAQQQQLEVSSQKEAVTATNSADAP